MLKESAVSRSRRDLIGAAIAALTAFLPWQAESAPAYAGPLPFVAGTVTGTPPAAGDQAAAAILLGGAPGAATAVNATAQPTQSRGLDEKWGEPLNTDLFDTRSVHGRLNYYYIAGQQGTQSGIGFTLTFPN